MNKISKSPIKQIDQLAWIFTNIPTDFAINLILGTNYDRNGIATFYEMKDTLFKKMLNWVTKNAICSLRKLFWTNRWNCHVYSTRPAHSHDQTTTFQ